MLGDPHKFFEAVGLLDNGARFSQRPSAKWIERNSWFHLSIGTCKLTARWEGRFS